jgi:hypothetical protein
VVAEKSGSLELFVQSPPQVTVKSYAYAGDVAYVKHKSVNKISFARPGLAKLKNWVVGERGWFIVFAPK